jgi:lactoylglutathione lyase
MALIHTCYRITDIDRSVAFYNALGFEEIGRLPIKDEAINVFMNQPDKRGPVTAPGTDLQLRRGLL